MFRINSTINYFLRLPVEFVRTFEGTFMKETPSIGVGSTGSPPRLATTNEQLSVRVPATITRAFYMFPGRGWPHRCIDLVGIFLANGTDNGRLRV